MRRGKLPLRRCASAISKAVFSLPGASLIAACLPAHSALAQVAGVITGNVTADYSTSTQNGQTVYGFSDSSANLNIVVPTIPVSAATGVLNWSNPAVWNNAPILLSNGGIIITGTHSSDAGAFMAIPTAAPTLVNTGPTEFNPIIYNINLESIQVPGVNASYTLTPFVTYDVTIPANSNINMDQQGVIVHGITVAANGTLTGDGNFTVRSNLVNQGTLNALAGTVQGNFNNQNFSDLTGALYVQGIFNNTGSMTVENNSSLNLTNPFTNVGQLDLYGGQVTAPSPLVNSGMIFAHNNMMPSVSNSHTGVIDIPGGGTPYMTPDEMLTNAGTLQLHGGTTLALDGQVNTFTNQVDPVTLNNLSNGTVQFLGDGAGLVNQTSGSGFAPYSLFNNAGLLKKTSGTGLSTVDAGIVFNDTGTIEVDSGSLQINGGGGFTGGSFVFKNNSQLILVHDYTVTGNNTASGTGALTLTYGSLFGSGTLNFPGATQFIATDNATIGNGLTNAGNMQIAPVSTEVFVTGTFTNTGTIDHTNGTLQVNANSTFNNSGTILQIGSNTSLSINGSFNYFTNVDSPSVVNNQLGAIYNLQGDGSITNPTSGYPLNPDATFNNYGTFEKTAGTNTSEIGPGINFVNSGTFSITSGTIQFDASVTNTGSISIGTGTRVTFNSPLTSTAGSITSSGSIFVFANSTTGRITGNGGLSISPSGNPTKLQLALNSGTSKFSSILVNPNSTLDIQNNTVAINFGSPSNDPIATIAGYLASGYNGGTWAGTEITSSTAAFNPAILAVGYADGNTDAGSAVAPNQILVKYTLAGDANLDGLVNFSDLVAVVQNFNKAGTDWAHGNFLYGASTNFQDLVEVIQNFNKVLTPAASSSEQLGGSTIGLVSKTDVQLPEPGLFGVVAAGAAGMLLHRRNRRKSGFGVGSMAKSGATFCS